MNESIEFQCDQKGLTEYIESFGRIGTLDAIGGPNVSGLDWIDFDWLD